MKLFSMPEMENFTEEGQKVRGIIESVETCETQFGPQKYLIYKADNEQLRGVWSNGSLKRFFAWASENPGKEFEIIFDGWGETETGTSFKKYSVWVND